MLDTSDPVQDLVSSATPRPASSHFSLAQHLRQIAHDLDEARRGLMGDRVALLVLDLSLLPWLATILVHQDLNVWMPLTEIGGIIFVSWFFTRHRSVEYLPTRRPGFETAIGLLLVILWMAYRVAQYVNLIQVSPIKFGVCDDFADTIIPKMLEMVVVPLAIFFALRYRARDLGLGTPWRGWLASAVPLLVLAGWGLSHQTPGGLFNRTLCFYLGAGLPEELLFRAILQPRLETLLRNPIWGLYFASLFFGASHLPINLHGTGYAHWPDAFLNAFTFQAGIGLALGFAFQRVRNLWPLTLVHALIDSAPLVCG